MKNNRNTPSPCDVRAARAAIGATNKELADALLVAERTVERWQADVNPSAMPVKKWEKLVEMVEKTP